MSDAQEVCVERLPPEEVERHLARTSVVYVPLGSVEFHGRHLPLGLDGLTGHAVCVRAARLGGGVVLPTMWHGVGGGHVDYPWTVMQPDATAVVSLVTAVLARLDQLGVGTAVLFTGHFADEQLAWIDRVAADWAAQHPSTSMRVVGTGVNRCTTAPVAPDHAGVFETSLLHAVDSSLVHVERLPDPVRFPAIDPDGDPAGEHRHDRGNPLWGVFGPDPRRFDRSGADALLEHLAEWLVGSVGPAGNEPTVGGPCATSGREG